MIKKIVLTALLAGSTFTFSHAQNLKEYGVVDLATNMMREDPDYAAELGDQALMGTVVKINSKKSYWLNITSPEPYTAWVNEMGVVQMTEKEKDAYINADKYIITTEYSHILTEPDAKSLRITDVVMGDLVLQCLDAKGKPEKKGRYVKVKTPSGTVGYLDKKEIMDFKKWVKSRRPNEDNIIEMAKKFVGVTYMWGGTSIKNVDCSGFARTVYFMNGILLPRNASQQARVGEEVSLDNLRPGDLVFWGRPATETTPSKATHVAIYMGNNKIIHSSQKVRINDLDRNADGGYDRDAPICARRILGNVDKNKGVISISNSPWYF